MKPTWKTWLLITFAAFAFMFVLDAKVNVVASSPNLQAEEKIEALLLDEIRSESRADFFVWMTEKADLSPAYNLPTKEEKGQFVYDTLRATADRTQKDLLAYLDSQGMRYQSFYIANKVLVQRGSESLLLAIANRSDVAKITANHTFQLEEPFINPDAPESTEAIEPNITFVNADDVWALGFTGQGTVLAGNDTGLQWDHPAIINHYRGWNGTTADHNYNWWDATGTYPTVPNDGHGHGTHTTGTMVGDDGGSNQIGVAPGAKTIHCKNMTNGGSGSDTTFTTCFQFDLAPWDLNGQNPNPALAPDAINNSWGYFGGGAAQFQDEIAALQAAGIVVEVSAGNEGSSCQTLRSPGDYGEVLTTGSVNHAGGSLPGTLTGFSSRGPSTLSSEYFPDIMAPGENIRSSVPGGGYQGGWSGTSMSGPHVTALIGLLWSANPGLRGLVTETYQIIKDTAVPLTGQSGSNCGGDYTTGPNNDWGYGTMDALAAVQVAILYGNPGTLDGTVLNSATSNPIQGVQVDAELGQGVVFHATTNASGYYSTIAFSGTYTVSFSRFGYFPETFTNVQVTEFQTTTLDVQLDPAPTFTVDGYVTDATTGWPLYAQINIGQGFPDNPVWTDPVTGYYSVVLPAGTYDFTVNAFVAGYNQTNAQVTVSSNMTQNFALDANLFVCTAPGYTPVPSGSFNEDFESGYGNWTMTGLWNPESQSDNCGSMVAPFPSPTNAAYYGQNSSCTFDNGNANIGELTLVSPVGVGAGSVLTFSTYEQTECSGPACPWDARRVQISTDGGGTWNTIYEGGAENFWRQETISLSSFAGAALIRFQFDTLDSIGNNFFGWMVDDINITTYTCMPPASGGLVVGNVYDANTSGTVNGAWITGDADQIAYAMPTPLDPNVDDAFYTIYSLSGGHTFTATYNLYGEDIQLVNVIDAEVVEQNFYLPSGFIITDPTAFDITLELGDNTTVPLILTDTGGANVEFLIREIAGTNPYVTTHSTVPSAPANPDATLTSVAQLATGGPQTPYRPSLQPTADGDILVDQLPNGVNGYFTDVSCDLCGGSPQVLADNFVFFEEHSVGAVNIWSGYFPADIPLPDNITIIFHEDSFGVPGAAIATETAVPTERVQTGTIIFGVHEYFHTFTLNNPVVLGAGTYWIEIYNDTGFGTDDFFWETGNTDPIHGISGSVFALTAPGSGWNFLFDDLAFQLVEGSGDVPWVSEVPISGTVPANGDFLVDVTFDAGEVPIPGQYTAFLKIGVDTPQLNVMVPLTLNVICPTCGTIQGDITDAATALPLIATLHFTNTSGFDFTLEDYSSYNIQLLPGHYYITASADGYLSDSAEVDIVTGQTTTQDFALWADTSILSFSPPSVEEFMEIGDVVSNTITVMNTGAAEMEFRVRIGGYSGPLSLVPISTEPLSIPPSDGDFPRGTYPTSIGPAPQSENKSTTLQTATLEQLLGTNAYSIDHANLFYTIFDTDVPEILPNVGPMPPTGGFIGAGEYVDGLIYMIDTNNSMWEVDPATGAILNTYSATPPGGGETYSGLALDPTSGVVYAGTTNCGNSSLYTIDAPTGVATLVGPISNGGCLIALAVDGNGDLWGYDIISDVLLWIDKNTAAGTVIGSIGFDANFGQGMGWDQDTDTLYMAAFNSGAFQPELRAVDRTTGNTTLIGVLGQTDPGSLSQLPWLGFELSSGGGWAYAVPDTGTVPPFSSTTFELVFDARSMYQVGDFYATLSFSGSFVNDPGTMPLTMHLSCPTCGFLAGEIYDSFTTAPVEADVLVTNGQGVTITLNGVSSYDLALQPGAYDFLVTADGYFPAEATVQAVQGQTTVTDFALVPIIALLEHSPASYERYLSLDMVLTDTLTIGNIGTISFDYELSDFQTGYSSPLAVLANRPTPTYSAAAPVGPLSVRSAEGQAAFSGPSTPFTWNNGAPLPGGQGLVRYAHAQCEDTPDSFYIISGVDEFFSVSSDAWRYDADTDTWTPLASFPAPQEGPAGVCYDGYIYVAGGGGTNQFYIYDIANDSWTAGPALPRFVWGPAMGAFDGQIFVIGGDTDFFFGGTSNEVSIYDIASGTWSSGTPMPTAAVTAGYTQIGSLVYVVGGWGDASPGSNVNATQRYDMANDTWETGATFTSGQADFALAATDTYLYAMGGDANGGGPFDMSSQVNVYEYADWPDGSWVDLGDPLPSAYSANNGGFCTEAVSGGEVWSFGGINSIFVITGDNPYRPSEGCAVGVSDALWLIELPAAGTVDPGGSNDVSIIFDTNVITQTGTYTASMRIRGNYDNTVDPMSVIMHVIEEAERAVAVAADQSSVQSPGATVTYTVDVTNNGNVSDIFTVNANSSAGWVVTLSDTSLLLNPGESHTVTVVVQVPASAVDEDEDVTTVTATSIYDPGVTDSVTLTTTVSVPPPPPTVFYIFLPYVSNEQ